MGKYLLEKKQPSKYRQKVSVKALVPLEDKNKVVISQLVLVAAITLLVVIVLILTIDVHSLANEGKVYLQIPGEKRTLIGQRKYDENYRSDELIIDTVERWFKLTYQWDNSLPGSENKDWGFGLQSRCKITNSSLDGPPKVPTPSWLAARLVAPSLRQHFLCDLFNNYVPKTVYREVSPLKSDIFIYPIAPPVRLKSGHYRVNVVSTITERIDNKEIDEFDVNRTLILQPIKADLLVFAEAEPSEIRKQVNQLLSNGLLIVSITKYKGVEARK